MSRSKNSRRGTRQKLPPFLAAEMQEMRDLNIARIGAPKAGDARRVQAANDRVAAVSVAVHVEWCECHECRFWLAPDFYDEDFDGYYASIWDDWKERQAS